MTDPRGIDYLRVRMATKLVNRELQVQEAEERRNGVVFATKQADAVADVIVAVFDLPLSPLGLRWAVQEHIRAAGPRPIHIVEGDNWYGGIRDAVAETLEGK